MTTYKAHHYFIRNILVKTTRAQHRIYASIMSKFNLPTCYISFHKDSPYQNAQHNSKQAKLSNFKSKCTFLIHCNDIKNAHFCKTSQKIKKLQFQSLFSLLLRTTNLSYQIDQGNKISCRPWPPMLHTQRGDSSITTFTEATSLLNFLTCLLRI